MELFAQRKVREMEKKKLKEVERNPAPPLSAEKREEMDRLFGFPKPVDIVYALGRDSSAAVWWNYEDDSNILEWEINRYRKDVKGDLWQHKGAITVKFLKKIKQIIFEGLTNGREYKFTVKAKNASGHSRESGYSNAVLVEPSLPYGWKRQYDAVENRYMYVNSHSNQSSISRPEIDPFFLEECVAVLLHPREIHHLKSIYEEEMLHFDRVTLERFIEIMEELGEEITRRDMVFYFRGYVDNDIEVISYQSFIDIAVHIKKDKMKPKAIKTSSFFEDKKKDRKLPKKTAQQQDYYVGSWLVRWSLIAERWYYLDTEKGGDELWCMPDEVKYHLSAEHWDKIHNHFDFGMVERIKMQFDEVNESRTGQISLDEFSLFLDCILEVPEEERLTKLHKMKNGVFFKKIDANNSGAIEFAEFALLMCKLAKRKHSSDKMIRNLQLSGLIHELAASGVISLKRAKRGPLHRGTSGLISYSENDNNDDPSSSSFVSDASLEDDEDGRRRKGCSRFLCCRKHSQIGADLQAKMLAALRKKKPVGPHGRYCLCGCRKVEEEETYY